MITITELSLSFFGTGPVFPRPFEADRRQLLRRDWRQRRRQIHIPQTPLRRACPHHRAGELRP